MVRTEIRAIEPPKPTLPTPPAPPEPDHAPKPAPAEVAARMWSALKGVSWGERYRPKQQCTLVRPRPTSELGGPSGHSHCCTSATEGVIAESFYYPINPADPQVLLLRADIRPESTDAESSIEVERYLTERLIQAFGAARPPENVYEIGASLPQPGLSWHTKKLTLFLHRNRIHVAPAGIRTGVQLIAVRDEILAQRAAMDPRMPSLAYKDELARKLPRRYFAPETQHPKTEDDRRAAEVKTHAALLALLRRPGDQPEERAAALVAADDLAVRLGGLLIARTIVQGSENLEVAVGADGIRKQLAKLGVRYGSIGHYSGDLEYNRSLLKRAWSEYPDTVWGQRALVLLQQQSCGTSQFRCPGLNCYLSVIEQGTAFLDRYPDTPLRTAQVFHLAQANETWWSLSLAQPDDITAEGSRVTRASAEQARVRAIEWYKELLRIAPGTPEARKAEIVIPRLKLKLDTGQRAFFCFSC